MIIRRSYIEQLQQWKDNKKIIKVITGVRRCGKSTLLKEYQKSLIERGVGEGQIISLNFEDLNYERLLNYRELYNFLQEKLLPDAVNYIFLDEVQRVPQFEKVVDSLYLKDNVDICIAGSNAFLLSGELATFLAGRYIEINMFPLSFKEYMEVCPQQNPEKAFLRYLRCGGFPYPTIELNDNQNALDTYFDGIYNTIVLKDIEERSRRRQLGSDLHRISNIPLLNSISSFLAGSVGSPISFRNIANCIISSGHTASADTVSEYVRALEEPYLFYQARAMNVSGKQLLRNVCKYYIVDPGLGNYILPKRTHDLGFLLENVVYLELRRRGYAVHIGKLKDLEVDFIARKSGAYEYFQITSDCRAEETFEREISPLRKIKDNYKKTILTLDNFTPGNYGGILVENAIDWLLSADPAS
ncbi:MAG: ATP-binding protein [Aeriscardovia sp.]|nr:ATP-binding protein [Aeriscardovia sp.]